MNQLFLPGVVDVLVVIGIFVVGVPFLFSHLPGEGTRWRGEFGLLLVLCALPVTVVWFIYFASDETQGAVIEAWGWFSCLVKLVVGFLLLGYGWAKILGGEGSAGYLAVCLGSLMLILGVFGLLSELWETLLVGG